MNYIEFIIIGIVVLMSVGYGIYYIFSFFRFKNRNNPCRGCPYTDVCNKKRVV